MVKDTSKKHIKKEAEKVKEVLVKKVEAPLNSNPEPTIKEVIPEIKKPVKMPKVVEKLKSKPKPKKLIQTGNESKSDVNNSEFDKIATGKSLGIYAGATIAVLIIAGLSYYAYTKLKNRVKKTDDDQVEILTKDIKSLTGVSKLENN